MNLRHTRRSVAGAVALVLLAGCSSDDKKAEPVATTTTAAPAESTTTGAPESTDVTTTTDPSTGAASLTGPREVGAGEMFAVSWTGPNAQGDYITIVAKGTAKWTNEPYVYANTGGSGSLVAAVEAGAYELWYVDGASSEVLARRSVTVTPFEGSLGAPAQVVAGSSFEVAWKGPNGPGDYVTIVAAGTARWSNEDYFDTTEGNPGTLVAPLDPGSYEIWYVTGADAATMARRPIEVVPYTVTLDAPATVRHGAQFEVMWTGPDGPSDYITIVPVGSPPGTYLSYAYTADGSPLTLTAPDEPGAYEIWYASDRVKDVIFGRTALVVT